MENKVINCFYHKHPLILRENIRGQKLVDCYVCGEAVTNSEEVYVCRKKGCGNGPIVHMRCGDLPGQICHPKHPQHPLLLFDYNLYPDEYWCEICSLDIHAGLGYRCSSCCFDVDLNCKKLLQPKKQLQHPCHPDHLLTLMRKPALAFFCDGCSVQDVDMAYICSTCEFWIHKTCASLPCTLHTNHHHHDLSLAFSFPMEHLRYIFDCDVCDKRLNRTFWVYFCSDCRFFAHVKCATSTDKRVPKLDEDDVIEFPLHPRDISMKLITPFVTRENKIPDMPTTIKMPETTAAYSFSFNYHRHLLTLVSESHEDHNRLTDEEDATNDELKICDVCVTPIPSPPYYECAACKYFVHSICYFFPKTVSSSSPIYSRCFNNKNHIFKLYTSSESSDLSRNLPYCRHCFLITNGRVYECEGCRMTIDVKCASLPPTIRHASHPHHKPLTLTRISQEEVGRKAYIATHCCQGFTDVAYRCSSEDCQFALDFRCVMLPASVTMLEWDKHPLLLTFDASLDHPSDFICGFCEEELHPKGWMYHCRQCDNSFHCFCLKAASGWFRNIKFGRRFMLEGIHPHPLTFNCVTIKRRCDICREDEYNCRGLECALCNYLMCLQCALKKLASFSLSPQ